MGHGGRNFAARFGSADVREDLTYLLRGGSWRDVGLRGVSSVEVRFGLDQVAQAVGAMAECRLRGRE